MLDTPTSVEQDPKPDISDWAGRHWALPGVQRLAPIRGGHGVDPVDPLPGGAQEDLTEDQQELLWYFWEKKSAKTGISKRTPKHAEKDLGWDWRKVRDTVQELVELERFRKDDSTRIIFPPNSLEPLRPKPAWTEPGEPAGSLVRRTGALRTPGSSSYKPKACSNDSPYGGISTVGYADGKSPTPRWVRINWGRETYDLVDYFTVQVARNHFGKAPGKTNLKALGVNIRRWLKEGLTPYTVKNMIDLFVQEPQFLCHGVPAWKSFLASRQRLLTLVEDRKKRDRMSTYWNDRRP